MGTKQFCNPQALSNALAALGMLRPLALRLLNCLILIVLAFNYYVWNFQRLNFQFSFVKFIKFTYPLTLVCIQVRSVIGHCRDLTLSGHGLTYPVGDISNCFMHK